jgi:hypothetical protein
MLISYWTAPNSSTPPISSITSNTLPYIRLQKLPTKHIYPKDGNCNICWNVGKLSLFNTTHIQKPKFYIGLQLQKHTIRYVKLNCNLLLFITQLFWYHSQWMQHKEHLWNLCIGILYSTHISNLFTVLWLRSRFICNSILQHPDV